MEKLYNQLPDFLRTFYEGSFLNYPLLIKIAYLGIFISALVILTCYCIILIRRLNQARTRIKVTKWKAEIDNILTSSIIEFNSEDYKEEDVRKIVDNLKELPLKKYLVRQLVINELMFLHKNFSGKVNTLISTIYVWLELEKHSKRKLNSWRWFIKAEGIEELSELGIESEADRLLAYVNSKNITLRMQAQSGYLQLSKKDPFIFLDYADQNLLTWHQINLMDVLNRRKDIPLPVFSRWFTSTNNSVVIFCIRLMVRFHQMESVKELLKLIKHPDEEVRKEMIIAIGELSLVDSERHLTIHFLNETLSCRLEIIKAVGKIASGDEFDFLSRLVYSPDFELRFEAAKAIQRHGDAGEALLYQLLETVPDENKSVVLHMLDKRLSA
ncbi:MAG TPA: HEAT repeat domain-containing protein [Daejeonella sp.]|nr:HEAT repeat domain-containing protein [Daejeonella sp.]